MMSVCRPYGAEIVCLCDSGAGQEAGLDTVLRCTLKQEPASPSRQDSRERNATSFTHADSIHLSSSQTNKSRGVMLFI